jgi:hypothetical protein
MITAITPTGDRLLAFSLCRRWMENQTRQPDQWIVVDDGKMPMSGPSLRDTENGFEYVRREPRLTDPKFTLADNLRTAIPHIKGNKILIIEDDEYYAPGYVATMARYLDKYEVVGIGRSRYYHLPIGGYAVIGNMDHASLAETGFRRSFLPEFRQILTPGKLYIDFAIWRKAKIRHKGFIFRDEKAPLYVGIKGLPGRNGIGRGHDERLYKYFDKDRRILKKWIPRDYQIYLEVLRNGND